MRLRHFVSLSAFILCGWLAVTFVTEVPVKRYPKLEKQVMKDGPQEPELPLAVAGEAAEQMQVSVSQ
ncbi:MAG TPA: hypothetical protein VLO11_03890 [Luteolibacter sp.]|nr:hypothetical protein [Luteolibacter sp.]